MSYDQAAYKRYYEKHKERILEQKREYKKQWYQKNKDRLIKKQKILGAAYKKQYPEKHCAIQAKRRANKLLATPKWLTNDQFKSMLLEYELAKWCTEVTGIQYDVDHIIPLKGKTVCGLHVPWNLRVVTASENRSKGNKYEWI